MVTMPDVPPNSSTTMARDFFCCMNFFSRFWADMVSGTTGVSMMRVVQSLGLRNISEEWMNPTM